MESQIEINDALITKWEPKVQKIASSAFVLDMDRDDIAQELRIAILKAAKGFDPLLGNSFHTYLHTTMMNTLRTLIVKAQRKHIEVQSMEELLEGGLDDIPSNKVQQALGLQDDSFDFEGKSTKNLMKKISGFLEGISYFENASNKIRRFLIL